MTDTPEWIEQERERIRQRDAHLYPEPLPKMVFTDKGLRSEMERGG